ncbi:MAG: 1-deoxy-D-xylulose-5-phosphate reductoisomerase [Lentisphaerae bacterium GWF2_45_14]|nr:MAG: 1-deoxy-D-xylulose-5-phosphate reductoisomerase [Lentisphaerae bacterium GWF2_45_14]
MKRKKRIVILGSTGSVGENAVKVAMRLSDRIEVVGIAAGKNVSRLADQAAYLNCRFAAIGNKDCYESLKKAVPPRCTALEGIEGLVEMATLPDVDMVLCSIVGTGGLIPVLKAIEAGKDIAIASKEVLVAAGKLVMEAVHRKKIRFLPVDSEHSAIFQCLDGKKPEEISRIILTASGGPFRGSSFEEMEKATYSEALLHPTWNMGPKVTIDSATLVNKGLEVIEARWLFGIRPENIDVVIHPQSIIHSMVEFTDHTVLAQMSTPDMRFPIQYALTYPEKLPGGLAPLDFAKLGTFTFEKPDKERFPSLELAYHALYEGGTMPTVFNAANESAVARFKKGEIKFTEICKVIEKTMSAHKSLEELSLDAILSAEQWARETALTASP